MTRSSEAQYELLEKLSDGDVFEHGTPFKFDTTEKLVWRCEEVVAVSTEYGARLRCTLHVYFRDVMLRALVVFLDPATKQVTWGSHEN